MNRRTHTYSTQMHGQEYVLEAAPHPNKGIQVYMTGWRGSVRAADHIVFQDSDTATHYQVEAIAHYCDTPDLWIARLVPCT